MLFIILIILIAIFLTLWLQARAQLNDKQGGEHGTSPDDYGQGYWDGYRAFGEQASTLIDAPSAEISSELQKLIAAGEHGETSAYGELGSTTSPLETSSAPVVSDDEVMLHNDSWLQDQEQAEEDEERETLRNLNILLYVASFLIVAAAALFVTLVMPAAVKLLSLIFVTLAFYATGLIMHANSTRLQPAATAFVGTGLAILPFIGFALTSLGGMSGEVAWLVTSLLGLVAYGVAAARLQSELISYLTMAFVISLALSAVSVLSLSIMWYFIVMMGVSLLCNLVAIMRPEALPSVFVLPVDQTSRLTTPIALAASLLVAGTMDLFMYQVLYGLATAHYLVIWLLQREWVYELVVRAMAHVTLLIVAVDVTQLLSVTASTESRASFGVWVAALAALQVIYSIVRVRPAVSEEIGQVERIIIAIALIVMGFAQTLWLGSEYVYELTAANLTVVGVLALWTTMRFREAGWAYVGLGVSIVLPFVVLRGIIAPAVPFEVIAGGFTILGLCALVVLDRVTVVERSQAVRQMLGVGAGAYALVVAFSGLLTGEGLHLMWTTFLAGGLYVGLSYLLRTPALEVVGAIFGILAVVSGVGELDVSQDWRVVLSALLSAVALLLGAALHHSRGEKARRSSVIVLAAAMLSALVFAAVGATMATQVLAVIILLASALVGVGGLLALQKKDDVVASVSRFAYAVYPFLALIVAWQLGAGWVALVFAVAAGVLWVSSYAEKAPALMIAGNVALVSLLVTLWVWLEFDRSWMVFGVAWLASAVLYGLYWLAFDKKDKYRQWIALGSIWVALAASSIVHIWHGDPLFVVAAAGSLLAGAALLGVQGYLDKEYSYIETAAYIATFAAQRITEMLIPETNMVVYAHWWAAVIAVAALLRSSNRQVRAIIALAFVTGSTGIYALLGQSGYQMVFLVEHLIILTASALLRASWAMWWGLVATILAVLYFLRDYTFLAPLFLGVLLIIFVVWRLSRMGEDKEA